MTKQIFTLTDAELDEVSGGGPNLGGYTACPGGLYVGGCPTPPTPPLDVIGVIPGGGALVKLVHMA